MQIEPFGCDKGSILEVMEITTYCTHYNTHGHTIEFCYNKYGHPQVNNPTSSSSTNAISSFVPGIKKHNEIPDTNIAHHISCLTHKKNDHHVCLVQQANLTPSPPHGIGSSSIQITTSNITHNGHTPNELISSSINIVISCSAINYSSC